MKNVNAFIFEKTQNAMLRYRNLGVRKKVTQKVTYMVTYVGGGGKAAFLRDLKRFLTY